jgi:formylglycine-generating enzyme required for sulfatase activity
VAGRLVLEDNFDAGPGKSGLEDEGRGKESTRGFHSPGVYHFLLTRPDETRHVVLPRFALSNFTLEVEMWDNSDDFTGSMSSGLVFRARDNDHFYAFLIDPRTFQYSVRKYDTPDEWADLAPWTQSDYINGRAEHNMVRIDGDGDRFSITLNGQPLYSFTDPSYPFGMLGMIATNHDAKTPHTHFDNLKVWGRDDLQPPAAPQVKDDPNGAMVLVQGGEFLLGGNEIAGDWVHIASVGSFYIDRTEVTNAVYARCVQAGKCAPQTAPASETHPGYANDVQYASYPVIHVTWQQAADFCTWAGKRLPTEAEWERAAGWDAATEEKSVWPWGNTFDPARLNSVESGRGDTSAVGQYPPEMNGTYDMAGNVWEWTSSLYKPYPYNQTDGREDPAQQGDRVLRGGSWAQTQGKARAVVRQGASPTYSDREIGFRCAATP